VPSYILAENSRFGTLALRAARSRDAKDGSAPAMDSNQTHHTGNRRRGDGGGHRGTRLCSADRAKRSCHGHFRKGAVRIHFEEAGSGFPLLIIAAAD